MSKGYIMVAMGDNYKPTSMFMCDEHQKDTIIKNICYK